MFLESNKAKKILEEVSVYFKNRQKLKIIEVISCKVFIFEIIAW